MRVLHTADWHLGQRFQNGHERLVEHRSFLDWLLLTIEAEAVDVLVVAGDVFDTGNPPAAARELYYSFLARLKNSAICHDVVIVGGLLVLWMLGSKPPIRPLYISKMNTLMQIILAAMALFVAGYAMPMAVLMEVLIWLVAATTLASGIAYVTTSARQLKVRPS